MKAKDLKVWQLRTVYHYSGDIKSLIEELKTLDTEQSADALVEAQERYLRHKGQKELLTFEKAGFVTRLLIPLIGRPSSYQPQKEILERKRVLRGPVGSFSNGAIETLEKSFVGLRTAWKAMPLDKALKICELLKSQNIVFSLSRVGVLEIYYPIDAPPSCFYTSEDPVVWRIKQEQKKRSKRISQVAKRLDRRI